MIKFSLNHCLTCQLCEGFLLSKLRWGARKGLNISRQMHSTYFVKKANSVTLKLTFSLFTRSAASFVYVTKRITAAVNKRNRWPLDHEYDKLFSKWFSFRTIFIWNIRRQHMSMWRRIILFKGQYEFFFVWGLSVSLSISEDLISCTSSNQNTFDLKTWNNASLTTS